MDLISLKCPNCSADLQFESSDIIGCCSYCGTRILLFNKDRMDLEFRLSDFIITDDVDSNSIRSDKVMEQAVRLIAEDDSAVGWYYKGLCFASNHQIHEAVECWVRTAEKCMDRDLLSRIYNNITKILVLIRFDHDRNFSEGYKKDRTYYPSLKHLDYAFSVSALPGYTLNDIYYRIIGYAKVISETDLSASEHTTLIDVLNYTFMNYLCSYGDLDHIRRMIGEILTTERTGIIRLFKDSSPRIDPEELSGFAGGTDPEEFLAFVKRHDDVPCGYPIGLWTHSVSIILIHHYFHERLMYHYGTLRPEEISGSASVTKERCTFEYIQDYDFAAMISVDVSIMNPAADKGAKKRLRDLAYSSADRMVSPLRIGQIDDKSHSDGSDPKSDGQKEKKKGRGLFGLFRR